MYLLDNGYDKPVTIGELYKDYCYIKADGEYSSFAHYIFNVLSDTVRGQNDCAIMDCSTSEMKRMLGKLARKI